MTGEAKPPSASARLCPRCGGPNDCALAMPPDARPAQCWCVGRSFPRELLAERSASCICRSCLELHASDEPGP